MPDAPRLAFYDLDGTLVSSNVVTQYVYYVRHLPSRWAGRFKLARLLVSVPALIAIDRYSRRLFNEVFYREYRGMRREWLREQAEGLFQEVLQPAIFPGARDLVESDRSRGFHTVLVTGSLDFAIAPLVRHFGFDETISNSLIWNDGVATGEISPPIVAESEKVAAMLRLCRRSAADPAQAKAYTDSLSDLPMLELVGHPAAVNPGRRLRRLASSRGWPVLDLG